MTPAEALWVVIGIIIIAVVAIFVDYCSKQAFTPNSVPAPIRYGIWGVAAILAILVLLWGLDVGGPFLIEDVD